MVELVFHTEPTISQPAAQLLQKVLQECPLLEDLPAEVTLFVSSLHQRARHQLVGSDDITEFAGFLATAFLQLAHSSTFQSTVTAKMGVDLGSSDVERATRVVGVIPCVLMMAMLNVHKSEYIEFMYTGPLLACTCTVCTCVHAGTHTLALAHTFLP